jgi:hypothetical protein
MSVDMISRNLAFRFSQQRVEPEFLWKQLDSPVNLVYYK